MELSIHYIAVVKLDLKQFFSKALFVMFVNDFIDCQQSLKERGDCSQSNNFKKLRTKNRLCSRDVQKIRIFHSMQIKLFDRSKQMCLRCVYRTIFALKARFSGSGTQTEAPQLKFPVALRRYEETKLLKNILRFKISKSQGYNGFIMFNDFLSIYVDYTLIKYDPLTKPERTRNVEVLL